MNVFITGATGFLGTELVKELVGEGHQVYLLVRSMKKASALLEKLPLNQRGLVHFIVGSIDKAGLDINEKDTKKLIGQIDIIYHTAAFLSFDETLREQIFKINVDGTKYVLDFAQEINAAKFIYVSTAYTLGLQTKGSETLYPLDTTFVNSYEASKCHSEHLVMSYSDRLHVAIIRPSIIIGNSITGEANTTFGLYGILRTVQLLKKRSMRQKEQLYIRFLINKDTVSNFVPVDYVVKALLLALHSSRNKTIYHVTNNNPPTNQFIFNIIKDVFDLQTLQLASVEDGATLKLTDFEQSVNNPLLVFENYVNRSISFENENTVELFQQNGLDRLKMDREMLYRIIFKFYQQQLVTN